MIKLLTIAIMLFSLPAFGKHIILHSYNTLRLDKAVGIESSANVSHRAKILDSTLPSGEPLYLVLDSPGGSIQSGLEMIQTLKNMNRPIHTIAIWCASMCFHTVQGLGSRFVFDHSTLMSHKAKGVFYGEFPGQLDSRYVYYLKRLQKMDKTVVSRTNGKHTIKSYANLYENEYWCEGEDCINQGLADEIITATCDKSLSGTYLETWAKFFWGDKTIEIIDTKSSCPLVTGWLSYDVYINGVKLFDINGYNTLEYIGISPEEAFRLKQEIDRLIKDRLYKKPILY